MPKRAKPAQRAGAERPPELLRKLIDVAMDLERRTMQLYCRFETLFPEPKQVRRFWFDMAQHESRHFGALGLVSGLLESAPDRTLQAAPSLRREHVVHYRELLSRAEAEAKKGVTLNRAFEIALELEGSEIEDLVLDLLQALKGEMERERAVQLLIHDLGDLSYMIERYARSPSLLARADAMVEQQLARHRGLPGKAPRAITPLRMRVVGATAAADEPIRAGSSPGRRTARPKRRG
jgi:rubrerythrin